MIYKEFQDLKLSALGLGTMRLPVVDGKDGEIIRNFRAVDDNGKFTFELSGSWIYIFHTRVAFLCLNLSFDRIETLQAICNPGWAYNPAEFFWSDPAGE